MVENVNIPEISQKHLHGIKDLTVDDINKILELSNFFKLNNKEKDKKSFKHIQQDSTELNGDGNRERGRYGEDLSVDE